MSAAQPSAALELAAAGRRLPESRSQLQALERTLRRHHLASAGAVLLVVVALASLLAPWLSLADPEAMRTDLRLAPPGSPGYLLGVDHTGRDMLSRLLWGGRVSLLSGLVPVALSAAVGIFLGVLAGYAGGWVDNVIMRGADVVFAFPAFLLAIGIAAALGPGLFNALLALTVVTIPTFARIARADTLSIKEREYVTAALTIGAGTPRILYVHVLRNAFAPLLVYATLLTGRMIIFAASLSFLGLGVQPPTAEWGAMLSDGRNVMNVAPHVATIPGLAIFAVTLALNLVGDALRDALDPRLRE